MVRVILAENATVAREFCIEHKLEPEDVVIVRGYKSLEGLRFRYEDVVRVPGWSQNPDIELIEEIILRTHIAMGYPEGVCTYGTALH